MSEDLGTIIITGGSVFDPFEALTRAAGGVSNYYAGGGSTRGSSGSGTPPSPPPAPDLGEVVVTAPPAPQPSAPSVDLAVFGFGPVGLTAANPIPRKAPAPRRAPPRRTQPKPGRTRPRRPQSPPKPVRYTPRPTPAAPALRRLAGLLGRFASRVLGPLSLLLHSDPAGPEDEYPTGPVLFPPKLEPRDERNRNPDPLGLLGEITVRGRRPEPYAPPSGETGLRPGYLPSPLVELGPLPTPSGVVVPRPGAGSPRPQPRTNPRPRGNPNPRIDPAPGLDPSPLTPLSSPRPGAKPRLEPAPFPGPENSPKTEAGKCNCPQQGKPKQKKKPKKKRTVCYRGTYTELRNGLRKYRKEKIPCR